MHPQDNKGVFLAYLGLLTSIVVLVAGVFLLFGDTTRGLLVCLISLLLFTLVGIFTLRHSGKVSEDSFLRTLDKVYSKIPGLGSLLRLIAQKN
jgi:amino acid transporter